MNNNQNKKATPKGKKKNQNGVSYAPLAITRSMKTGVPSVAGSAYTSDGRVRIRHREYIGDVLGSVAFSATAYAINPGLTSSFTWLAPIATQFESYLFRSLKYEFETQKSASTSGTVMLAVDYDASDAVPASKQQLMSYHDSVRSAVWNECCFTGDVRDLQKFGIQRYIRGGALAANLDVKTFDVGNFIVATQGCADATAIGELYVSYDIELITPQSDPAAVALAVSAKITGNTGVSRTAVFGSAAVMVGGLPCSALNSTLTFNRVGNYILSHYLTGTVLSTVSPTIGGTCTALHYVSIPDAAATTALAQILVKVNNVGETLTLDYTPASTTVSASILRIGQYAYTNA